MRREMRSIILTVAGVLVASAAWAQNGTWPSSGGSGAGVQWTSSTDTGATIMSLYGTCVDFPGSFKLCGGDKPTIWISPKLTPRDVANRMIGAFQALGYIAVPSEDAR